MRLELSLALQKRLDQIKDKAEYWPGKGYAKVIAMLVREHEERESIDDLMSILEAKINGLPECVELCIEDSLKLGLANVVRFALSHQNKTKSEGPCSRSLAGKRRK